MIRMSIGILVLAIVFVATPAMAFGGLPTSFDGHGSSMYNGDFNGFPKGDYGKEDHGDKNGCFGMYCGGDKRDGDGKDGHHGDHKRDHHKKVIPTPSAALAGLALIGGLAVRRRRSS